MKQLRVLLLAAAAAASLAACDRGATSGPNATDSSSSAVPGTTGRGPADQPGSGLQGGLGNNTARMGGPPSGDKAGADPQHKEAPVPGGSNRTSGSSYGNRP